MSMGGGVLGMMQQRVVETNLIYYRSAFVGRFFYLF